MALFLSAQGLERVLDQSPKHVNELPSPDGDCRIGGGDVYRCQ
jgi:hypothetical protein